MDIQQNIFQYFETNPNLHILFVFNNMYIFDDLESMQWPDEYAFVIFNGKFFETKYRLENELANKRVILCFPELPSPISSNTKDTFPLLDLLCANMEYMSDAAASYIQQHRIPSDFEPFVRRHFNILLSSRFAPLIESVFASPEATIEMALRALLSGFFGESRLLSWHEVFLNLILLENELADARKNTFYRFLHNPEQADVLHALQNKWKSIFGFDYSPNDTDRIEQLACALKYNSITQGLTLSNIDPYSRFKVINSIAIDEINRIMEQSSTLNAQKRIAFQKNFDRLAAKIREDNIINCYGVQTDYFYYTPRLAEAIIQNILQSVNTQFAEAIKKLSALQNRIYFDEVMQNLIAFSLHLACFYRELSNVGKLKLNTPEQYILQYTNKYYMLDTEYRMAIYHFGLLPSELSIADHCFQAKAKLNVDYAQIANQINLEWIACLSESGTNLNDLPCKHQYDIYKDIINQTTRYVVIVSDAFRYEVAKQLTNTLAEERHTASLGFALAQLPTETKFCIPTLLPHEVMALANNTSGKPDVAINGKVRPDTASRTELLQQYNAEAICFNYKDLKGIGSTALREKVKRPLTYIFHNVIDSLGHDGGPVSLPQACTDAVNELSAFINTLLNSAKTTNVILTADHGFLYNDIRFEDKDKYHIDEQADEKTSRYYLTQSDAPVIGIAKFPFTSVHGATASNNLYVAVPQGTNRLFVQGSNYQFAHGGASLQELIIPVLSAKRVEKENRQPVHVELLSNDIRIVSGRTRIQIYQADPVSASFREQTITIAIYDGNHPVTAIKEITLDKSSSHTADRIIDVDLMLNANDTPNIMQLRIFSTEDPINPLKTASVTNNTLIERDF